MKILIKGAGDLATGIAARLHACGYKIVMTEIAVPLTVRRSVAFSRAVYEGEAQVEDVRAVLVRDLKGAEKVLEAVSYTHLDVYKRQVYHLGRDYGTGSCQ